jgi:NTPase
MGERIGFDVVTVDGKRGELARVGFKSRFRGGRYGVNLEKLEQLTLPELVRRDVNLIVVDEIGKMEMLLRSLSPRRGRRSRLAGECPGDSWPEPHAVLSSNAGSSRY